MKSDKQLRWDVLCELEREPAVHTPGIEVEVHDGLVTLLGHARGHAERLGAERAAQRVRGVMALALNITVAPSTIDRRDDADIARAAVNLLSWLAGVPRGAVAVEVEEGRVTLSGQLEWTYQRHAASEAVQDLAGVVSVCNLIVIKARVRAAAVAVDIEAALERRARIEARGVTVEVDGGNVTLGGSVGTCGERQMATDAAWGIPGVRTVLDRITLRN